MAFLNQLKSFNRDGLSKVETIVTKESGERVKEIDGKIVIDPNLNLGQPKDRFFMIDAKPDESLNEVTKGLFIGSQDAASNYTGLKEKEITHIFNAAIHIDNFFPNDFVYKSEALYDEPTFDVTPYLDSSADYINDTLKNDGKMLVHCNAGISRSSTLILAYLMKWRKLSLDDGLIMVREVRPFARPNARFMMKLKEFETILISK